MSTGQFLLDEAFHCVRVESLSVSLCGGVPRDCKICEILQSQPASCVNSRKALKLFVHAICRLPFAMSMLLNH